ncbi:hypothetical protein BV22DRAFT_1030668 [Leucogyrophana mollusca]|uniref:Uncharacterized protein n=1 Tax=Leucogyrophana mollusca TaxID=85980 RepID=A0ACB8BSN5_9AGAM|nr:hypothetical protein BV22DRAFT_1030668 [Leucogyrophana mollusca]
MDDGGDGGSVLATWKKEVLEGRHKESVLKGRETDSRPSDASPSSNREDARKESAEDGPSSSKGGGSTELHNTELSPVQDESSFAAAGPQLERKGSKAS